jgi:hypothetical protein
MVRITMPEARYIESFLAENKRACQGGGSHKTPLYEATGEMYRELSGKSYLEDVFKRLEGWIQHKNCGDKGWIVSYHIVGSFIEAIFINF